jgi:site-specific recombinase XerD
MGTRKESLVEDLKLRNYSDRTVDSYASAVKGLVAHFMRPPEKLGEAEIREYLLHLKEERRLEPATRHGAVAAIKFFYSCTLGQPEVVAKIPYPKVPKTLHDALSRQEVEDLLARVTPIKHRVVLIVVYSAGLRISEACSLQFGDIDRGQGVIHVRKGKGSKDRYVMLGARLLDTLVAYYTLTRPPGPYFFTGRRLDRPMSGKRTSEALARAREKMGLRKRVTTHSLRHAFATHLLEDGVDVRVVQVLLGHSSIRTTTLYAQVTPQHIARIKSPFDKEDLSTLPAR